MSQSNNPPHVSAIVIVGSQRIRAQQCITALCTQANAHQLEIVIVDYDLASYEKLTTTGEATTTYLTSSKSITWGRTRAYAVQQSSAPIIAFLEEHTQPQPGWLTAVISAFETHNLSAATYSFISGNPYNYVARAGHVAEYGLWTAPASAVSSSFLPWNNYVVSRSFLMSSNVELDQLLENDTLIYDLIRRTKKKHMQINEAVLAHISSESMSGLLIGTIYGSQLLAHQRVQVGNWSWMRRIVYALGVPLLVPFMRLSRLFRHYLTMPQNFGELIVALPFILLLYFAGSLAEGVGYIIFTEKALEGFIDVEIYTKRKSQIDT